MRSFLHCVLWPDGLPAVSPHLTGDRALWLWLCLAVVNLGLRVTCSVSELQPHTAPINLNVYWMSSYARHCSRHLDASRKPPLPWVVKTMESSNSYQSESKSRTEGTEVRFRGSDEGEAMPWKGAIWEKLRETDYSPSDFHTIDHTQTAESRAHSLALTYTHGTAGF